MRRLISAMLIFLLLHSTMGSATALDSTQAALAGAETATRSGQDAISSEFSKKVFAGVSELVSEYYGKAKFAQKGNKIHFEYKVRPFTSVGQRQELAPDFGGVLGDLELIKGEYKGHARMPQQYAEHTFHSIVLMAPYSREHNCHLYTRLSYPSDATQEFVDRFKDVINDLAKNKNPSANSVAPSNTVATFSTPTSQSSTNSGNNTSGSSPGTSSVSTTNTSRGKKAYIWKATKGKDVVYLLGTIHGSIQQFYPLPAVIDKAFEQSKHLVVEVDILHVDDSTIPTLVQKLSRYKPPDKLSKHLSPDTKKLFEKFLSWSGGNWEMYEEYKPWFAARLASGTKEWEDKDFKSSLGIDLYLLNRARDLKKVVSDLETPELQIRASSDNSDATQDAMLCSSLIDLNNSKTFIRELLAIWKEGDLEKMNEATKRDTRRFPALAEYDKRMLDDRNVGMANKVEQFLKTKPGPHFVAVGAAHMCGPMGLVELFQKRGYDVQQLYSNDDLKPVSSVVATASSSSQAGSSATASASSSNSSSASASTGSSSAAVTASAKLDKTTYVEQFRVWLPGTPKRVIDNSSTTHYEFSEPPFGGFAIFAIGLEKPTTSWTDPGPLVLDRILSPFPKTVISQRTITLQGFTGRELICVPKSAGERRQSEENADKNIIQDTSPTTKGAAPDIVNFGPYMAALQRKVKRNWFPPANNLNKKVSVIWEANRDGTISKLRIDKSSGEPKADEMALQAVRRSVPFPPLPKGSPPSVAIQFKFDYNVMHMNDQAGTMVKGAPGLKLPPSVERFADLITSGTPDSMFGKIDKSDLRSRIQVYLVHRQIFLVAACGTKEWLDSDNVKQFFDSFELIAKSNQ